ncbi:mechanosensitive ion channel family protein [Risungbinella massiliensis]|uniref:mechanosensitive ion channel family protein n=1 Tax=Risungbinella massiliensis TaxID=1329796 RepID=UPI000B1AD35D|nr:mechanosensitive ion channel family protein [Risungbinella massiliensis]
MFQQFLEESSSQPPSVFGDLWTNSSNLFQKIIENPLQYLVFPIGEILLIALLTYFAVRLVNNLVDRAFSFGKQENNKAQTLQKLIKSVAHYVIYFISMLTILAKLGINLGPVLAGAGILGLAIGFGAQSLVKDVITGFFLIFERQLEVGDTVEINSQINGTVEEVGLRVTKIREYNQRLHYLPNGTITQVTNYNREKMRAIVKITVPYESDLDIANQALEDACDKVYEKYEKELYERPSVVGITNIDSLGVHFTIHALSKPTEFWSIEREMRKQAVLILHRQGISIAYPRSVISSPDEMKHLQTTHP